MTAFAWLLAGLVIGALLTKWYLQRSETPKEDGESADLVVREEAQGLSPQHEQWLREWLQREKRRTAWNDKFLPRATFDFTEE
ncbi:MAG: hypothetical protein GXO36_00830, partial [Chloroflexi bacterium]|nr:hypothetical protein [Chloroflexota bacterium]